MKPLVDQLSLTLRAAKPIFPPSTDESVAFIPARGSLSTGSLLYCEACFVENFKGRVPGRALWMNDIEEAVHRYGPTTARCATCGKGFVGSAQFQSGKGEPPRSS
jgi:hypothetical protein